MNALRFPPAALLGTLALAGMAGCADIADLKGYQFDLDEDAGAAGGGQGGGGGEVEGGPSCNALACPVSAQYPGAAPCCLPDNQCGVFVGGCVAVGQPTCNPGECPADPMYAGSPSCCTSTSKCGISWQGTCLESSMLPCHQGACPPDPSQPQLPTCCVTPSQCGVLDFGVCTVSTGATTTVPHDGIVAWFPFDFGSYQDGSGMLNAAVSPLSGVGTSTDRFSRPNRALLVDGASTSGIVVHQLSQLGPQLTVAMWILPSGKPMPWPDSHGARLISNENGSPFAGLLELTQEAPSSSNPMVPHLGIYTYGLPQDLYAGQVVSTWTHLAVTFDGASANLYLNGTSVAAGPLQPAGMPTLDWAIGNRPDGAAPFSGSIDDVYFYARALSQSEIQALVTQPAM